MALILSRPFRTILGLGVLIAAGCQSPTTSTAGLPGPNFAGPSIRPPAYTPPAIAVLPPAPKPANPAPRAPANVPSSWIPLASAEQREWTWIVVHHSATDVGGAARFDKEHRSVRGWNGLGYDFVIGNGTDTPDGAIEVGYRWPIQAQGAHAVTPDERFNKHGIGICLVGNFNNTRPTAKQMASLAKLGAYLADTYHIRQSDIIGHRDTKQTDCPGKNVDINQVRQLIAARRTTVTAEAPAPKPGEELMQTATR